MAPSASGINPEARAGLWSSESTFIHLSLICLLTLIRHDHRFAKVVAHGHRLGWLGSKRSAAPSRNAPKVPSAGGRLRTMSLVGTALVVAV
jgi:hypothetical protein